MFPYSERENTLASSTENKIDKQIISERTKKLIILSNKLQNDFYQTYINTNQNVLFEQNEKNGMLFGFTDN